MASSENHEERLKAALADRYAIESEIGSGGMATVYLAQDLKHDRQVAVKVLDPNLAQTLGAERFLREIKLAANLNHPHILPVHDSGEADGFLFYVMPYVEGESLRDRLAKETELPVQDAVRILRDVTDALAAAHEVGVVHRDIKPDNVLLSGRHAVVADFGVAKAVSEATGHHKVTTAGVALGTPTYMAPEQAAAEEHIDHRADIYAVGVLAYEMLTGRPPFTASSPRAILSAHVTDPVRAPRELRASLSPPMEAVILRCLEKKAADRFQETGELLDAFESLMTPSGGRTPTTAPLVSRAGATGFRRWGMWLGAAAALVVVGALAVMAPRWYATGGGGSGGAAGEAVLGVAAATDEEAVRIAVLPFEVRGSGDDDLSSWGELASEGITRELDRSQIRNLVPFSAVRAARTAASVPAPLVMAEALDATHLLTGTVTRLGGDVRFDMEFTRADGSLVRALEPVTGSSEGIQDLIEDIAEQGAGAILALTDPHWPSMARGTLPPSTEVYHNLVDAYDAFWCQQDWRRSAELLNGILTEHPDHIPSLIQLLPTYRRRGEEYVARELGSVVEQLRPLVPRMTTFERAMYQYHGASVGVERLNAARRVFAEDPTLAGYALADVAYRMFRFDLAMEGLEAIDYENDCGWVPNWTLRAEVHHIRGEYADELHWIREGLVRFPDNETLLRAKAGALAALDSLEALSAVVETLRTHPSPNRAAHISEIGSELITHGHSVLGEEILEEGLSLQRGERQSAWRALMTPRFSLGDWEGLLPLVEEVIADPEVGPVSLVEAYYYRVFALVRLGRADEAEAAQAQLEEVLNPRSHLRIALPLALGDVRGVVNELREVLALGGALPDPGWTHRDPEWKDVLQDPAFEAFIRQVTSGEGG